MRQIIIKQWPKAMIKCCSSHLEAQMVRVHSLPMNWNRTLLKIHISGNSINDTSVTEMLSIPLLCWDGARGISTQGKGGVI